MNDTLLLFDELLEHDAGSRIFFPLARLHVKHGDYDRALAILEKGLENHPEHIDACLLRLALLEKTGQKYSAKEKAVKLLNVLQDYPVFWELLREHFSGQARPDLMLATALLRKECQGQCIDVFALLNAGLDATEKAEFASVSFLEKENLNDFDAEEVTQLCIDSGIKTKTMAKLLIAQGETEQARDIYDQLLSECTDCTEKKELKQLRDQLFSGVKKESKSTKIYTLLDSLAERLESR